MFGGNHIGNVDGLIQIFHLNQRPPVFHGGPDDGLTLQRLGQCFHSVSDLLEVIRVRAQKDRLSLLIVFRLGKQVHGNPVRIGFAVAHHQNFRRAGDHVDAHLAKNLALGFRHVDIAGADNLVHRRHGVRAVGQGRHRLGATHRNKPVYPGDGRRRQHHIVELAPRRRRYHDDVLHARHLGGQGIHQHRAGIGRLATGHIDPCTVQRRHLLAQQGAIGLAVRPGILFLLFVIAAHPCRCRFQRLTLFCRNPRQGGLQLVLTHHQICGGTDLAAIKPRGVLHQCSITAFGHIPQDALNPLGHFRIALLGPGGQGRQPGIEVSVLSVEPGGFHVWVP